jgi:allene oxide cyclase
MKQSGWVAVSMLCGLPLASFGAERLQFVERASTDVTVDVGAKGDSTGDLLTFSNPIFDMANQSQLGSNQGYCVRIVPARSWECSFTVILKGGQIVIAGPYLDGKDSIMGVTGGTGKYAGAKGSMALHARDANGSTFDFTFELL